MRIRYRHLHLVLIFLFCTQTTFYGKYCLGQVGFAWDPSCALDQPRPFGLSHVHSRGSCELTDYDCADRNDIQRKMLFDYYNANRYDAYSADGVSGWDTSCYLNPLKQCQRQKQWWQNVDSHLYPATSGTVWVAPFAQRVYGPRTTTITPEVGPASVVPELPADQSPQTPLPVTPQPTMAEPSPDFSTDGLSMDSNSHGSIPDLKDGTLLFEPPALPQGTPPFDSPTIPEAIPTPEGYEDAVGDVPPEFEWDESLLDELPELNRTTPKGNPAPPSSGNFDELGRVEPRSRSNFATATHVPRSVRSASRIPRTENALEAAIRLQSLEADLRTDEVKPNANDVRERPR